MLTRVFTRIFGTLRQPEVHERPGIHRDINRDPRFPAYRASCFAYCLAGALRLSTARLSGWMLICQALFSYMSDVHTLGAESWWHAADRLFALATCAAHFASLDTPASLAMNLVAFSVALTFLDESQEKYAAGDRGFLTAHTRWHLMSLVMAVL